MMLGGLCSLEDLVAGAWQAQERLECLADGADHPTGLQRGLASMSAVAQQRSRLQVHNEMSKLQLQSSTEALILTSDSVKPFSCCLLVLPFSLCVLCILFLLLPALWLDS